jgi:hypothetical protein
MASLPKVLSSIVHQLANGTPIWKITVPASIHTDKSGIHLQKDYMFTNPNTLEAFNKVASSKDPVERIGLIILGSLDPFMEFSVDKPFNPVQGEFISVSTELESGKYLLDVEQIWHHPPVLSFRLTGPTFEMRVPTGMDSTGGFKPSINSIEISFPNSIVELHAKDVGTLEWSQPHFKLENIVFGKRTGSLGGDWWIRDPSGVRFEGKILSGCKLKGDLIAYDGSIIDSVEGDMIKGVYFKKSKKLWIKAVKPEVKVKEVFSTEVLNDPCV